MSDIVVFGSLNADLVLEVPALPSPGETVLGGRVRMNNGGKGANQAVAAARLAPPGRVRMVGRVGDDEYGRRLLAGLAEAGVEVGGVLADPAETTGLAMILVDASGENVIAVSPGANGAVNEADIARATAGLRRDDVVVCQFEVPLPAVRALAAATRSAGAKLVCNAAPAALVEADFLAALDVLVVNEAEARVVLGAAVETPAEAAAAADRTRCSVVVTLGADGAVYAEPHGSSGRCPAPVVDVVDTVGAGDAFVGALAVALAEGRGLAEATAAGVAAGSQAVTQVGAQAPPLG